MTDHTFAEAQDEAAQIREDAAYPEEAFDRAAYHGEEPPLPVAKAVQVVRDTLKLVEAQPDMTTHLRGMFSRIVWPDVERLVDRFERQEKLIEEQRIEILRLTRFADRAEATDTRNKLQLIAAQKVLDALGTAINGLVPMLEHLVDETRAAHLGNRDAPLLR